MAQKLYRVVEAKWIGSKRVELDIGCAWKSESAAKEERKELERKQTSRTFSIQKKI